MLIKEVTKINPKTYSRISAFGINEILFANKETSSNSKEKLPNKSETISQLLGYKKDRVEKDLTFFNSSLEKMNQAIELMEEAIKADKKKKESNSEKSN